MSFNFRFWQGKRKRAIREAGIFSPLPPKPAIPNDQRQRVKVALMGEPGIGKRAFALRAAHKHFRADPARKEAIGVNFSYIAPENHPTTTPIPSIQLTNIAGQERLGNMINVYLKLHDIVFLMFDVNKPDTFEALSRWLDKLADFHDSNPDRPPLQVVLVGTKTDLVAKDHEAVVTSEAINQFMEEEGIARYFEVSSKTQESLQTEVINIVQDFLAERLSQSSEIPDVSLAFSSKPQLTHDAREKLKQALRDYIHRINCYFNPLNPYSGPKDKKDIKGFQQGFSIMKHSRAANRAANYYLAKSLFQQLQSNDKSIAEIFDKTNLKHWRAHVITTNGIRNFKDYQSRDIHSAELNRIIKQAHKLAEPASPTGSLRSFLSL